MPPEDNEFPHSVMPPIVMPRLDLGMTIGGMTEWGMTIRGHGEYLDIRISFRRSWKCPKLNS